MIPAHIVDNEIRSLLATGCGVCVCIHV